MAVALSRFYPYVEPYLIGAPKPLLDQRLVAAAVEFCEQTHVVQQVTEPAPVNRGESEVDLELEPQTALVSVLEAWFDRQRLALVPQQASSVQQGHYPDTDNVGTPGFALVEGQTLKLYPRPALPGQVTVKMAVKPVRDARVLPDGLYEDWAQAIGWGAVAQLAQIPAQSFSNLDLAQLAALQFRAEVARATVQAAYGRMRGNLRVRQRPFA